MYYATIHHHSIARARTIPAGDTLTAAKRAASREFGSGFLDHEIVVYRREYGGPVVVSRRRIGSKKWLDRVMEG